MVVRLLDKYKNDVVPALTERFGYGNQLAVPKLEKIVISMGIGDGDKEEAKLQAAAEHIGKIAGQKPVITLSKKAISNFKLRKGMKVGLKVTLRGPRMYEFLDRLIALAIPRVRDFRGLQPSGFDGRGNYNMGLAEQTVFPEVDPSKVTFTHGMNINLQTTAETDEEALGLLTLMGMPFRKD